MAFFIGQASAGSYSVNGTVYYPLYDGSYSATHIENLSYNPITGDYDLLFDSGMIRLKAWTGGIPIDYILNPINQTPVSMYSAWYSETWKTAGSSWAVMTPTTLSLTADFNNKTITRYMITTNGGSLNVTYALREGKLKISVERRAGTEGRKQRVRYDIDIINGMGKLLNTSKQFNPELVYNVSMIWDYSDITNPNHSVSQFISGGGTRYNFVVDLYNKSVMTNGQKDGFDPSWTTNGSTTPAWQNTSFDNVTANSTNPVIGILDEFYEGGNVNRWVGSGMQLETVNVISGLYSGTSNNTGLAVETRLPIGRTLTDNFTWIFDLNYSGFLESSDLRSFVLENTIYTSSVNLRIRNSGSGAKLGYYGSAATDLIVLNPNQTYNIKVNVCPSCGASDSKFDVYVNGTLVGSNLETRGTITSFTNISVLPDSAAETTDEIRFDNMRIYLSDFGNVTAWYDSGSGNEVYQLEVNATTPTNTNYTLTVMNNDTNAVIQTWTAQTGNNSFTITGAVQDTKVNVTLNGNQTATPEIMQVTFFDQAAGAEAGEFMPPTPISLSNTTGNFWVNYTWSAGSGNVTDSYNISITNNSIQSWSNQTVAFLNSTLASHQWSNISVYAFNSSGTGTLNTTPVSMNTQVQNNNPVISFIDPTLANGSTNTTGSIHINTSVSDIDSDNMTALLNWNNSLVGWWRMNENAGGTLVQDFSGHGNNGTWNGNTTSNVTLGPFGNALQFDGVDDYVQIDTSYDTNNVSQYTRGNNSYTFSAWINGTSFGENAILGSIYFGWNTFMIDGSGTQMSYHIYNGVDNWAISKAYTFLTNTWYNVAITYNRNTDTATWYVNSISIGTSNNLISPSRGIYIIGSTSANHRNFNGTVDEVRIYNRVLSQDEINASYNAGLYRLQNNITNLADGEYNYTAYIQDSSGVVNSTEIRYVTVNATGAEEGEFMPPTPINLAQINGSFWVNHTWQANSGNGTDSYNVSITNNSIQSWSNQTVAFLNSTLASHQWSNISVWAFNSSGNGTLNQTPASMNTQVPNNAPVQSAIGNKNVTAGNWMNFSVNVTDIDSDTITYGTNASKGTLNTTTGNFNWSTTSGDVGTYYWNFNSSDVYGGVDNETITITVNAEATGTPNITAYYNTINGWNQTAMSVNAGNSVTFNVTVNQTVNNVSWKVEGAEEQNTSSLQFTRVFNTLGTFNVTAQAFNANGSSNIIYTVVTVTTTGGGGTNWDYAYGWVNWTNGTMINGASVSTSKGTVNTNAAGYYVFGYVFEHGISYDFNISKNGIWDNKTVFFAVGDYQVVNGTLQAPITNGTPNITSWGNDNTSNATNSLSVLKNTNITFNATANQTLTGCTWTGASQINCTANTYAYKNFTSVGIQTVSITGINGNGSTQTITWIVTVTGTGGLSLSGYVKNTLEIPLENARIDFNSGYNLTNTSGYYLFSNVSEGTYTTLARAIGYSNATNATTINTDTIINFTLRERMNAQVVPGFEVGILLMVIAGIYWLRKKKDSA